MHAWVWLFWRHRFSVYLKITKISLKNAHFSVFGPISVGFSPISVVFFFKIIIWTISDIMVTFFFRSGNPVIPQFRKMYPKISFLTFSVKKLPISFVLLIQNSSDNTKNVVFTLFDHAYNKFKRNRCIRRLSTDIANLFFWANTLNRAQSGCEPPWVLRGSGSS